MIHKKKIIKRADWPTAFISVLLGVVSLSIVVSLFVSNLRINSKRAELASQVESLKQEIKNTEDKIAALQSGISQAQTDIYWEEKAREQGYKRPGEEQVVVLPPETDQEKKAEMDKSFWQKLLDTFGF